MPSPVAPTRRVGAIAALITGLVQASAFAQARSHAADDVAAPALATERVTQLARTLQVGDMVFTRIGTYPFRKVAEATGT